MSCAKSGCRWSTMRKTAPNTSNGHVFVGQGGVMFGGGDLASSRQYPLKVMAPDSGVRASSIFVNRGSVQKAFDAPANAVCGLGLVFPDRVNHLADVGGVD